MKILSVSILLFWHIFIPNALATETLKADIFSADWCGQCKVFKKHLKQEKQDKSFEINVKGVKYKVVLNWQDVTDKKVWRAKEKVYGKISGVPNLRLSHGKRVLASNVRLDYVKRPSLKQLNEQINKILKAKQL